MSNLLKVIVYVLTHYPRVEELSKPRLVKVIYLSDWKHAINNGEQFTEISWFFNHYGPYVDDVINTMKNYNSIFEVKTHHNPYGGYTDKFRLINVPEIELPNSITSAIDFVIEKTHNLTWSEFISIVYTSYPVANNPKYSYLDLKAESLKFNQLV